MLLERLARQRGGALAVVSGRRIADLDQLLHPWRGAAAGLHGGERRRPDGSRAEPDLAAEGEALAALDRLRPHIAEAVRRWPGVRIEDKGKTLAIHYREAPNYGGRVGALARAMRAETGSALRLIAGKMVYELQPHLLGKDGAIAAFMAEEPFRGRVPVFLGDDTTDEDGFAAVNRCGGLSIHVGAPVAESRARYALHSVAAAYEWLAASP
jgi:trehalose 6-phosphate phosphatase